MMKLYMREPEILPGGVCGLEIKFRCTRTSRIFPLSPDNSHIFLVFGYFTKWILTSNVFNNLAGKFLNYLDPIKKYLPWTPHRK